MLSNRSLLAAVAAGLGLFSALASPCALGAEGPSTAPVPPSMASFELRSGEAILNGFVYRAAGAGPHPVALFLHGFPGNEKNLDLAQAVRGAGRDALCFDDDHVFSASRLGLGETVTGWLNGDCAAHHAARAAGGAASAVRE